MIPRPPFVSDAMLTYLDKLAAAGRTGWGVTADLEREFRLTPQEAATVLSYWRDATGGAK
jgi:hypothetical protein